MVVLFPGVPNNETKASCAVVPLVPPAATGKVPAVRADVEVE